MIFECSAARFAGWDHFMNRDPQAALRSAWGFYSAARSGLVEM